VVYNAGDIPIYQHPNKEIFPQGEHRLSFVLSLLPSVVKTKGKAERAFWVAVTPLGMALTTRDPASLKAQVLIMSPVSEGIQFKENLPEEGLNERQKCTEGQEGVGRAWGQLHLL
jgi:hypothetical protein